MDGGLTCAGSWMRGVLSVKMQTGSVHGAVTSAGGRPAMQSRVGAEGRGWLDSYCRRVAGLPNEPHFGSNFGLLKLFGPDLLGLYWARFGPAKWPQK